MNRRQFMRLSTATLAATVPLTGLVANAQTPTPVPQATPTPTRTPTLIPGHTNVTLPNAAMWNMTSRFNEQTYRILAGRRGALGDKPLPVIYITDGNGNFPFLYVLHQQLVDDGYLPPALLVGVDYVFDAWDEYKDLRSRDFTPTVLAPNSPYASLFPRGTGGAPAFLQFLEQELQPWIDSQFRTLPNDATLTGHSLGGLFALYALFAKPKLFQRYVIGSPSIWYDNKSILKFIKPSERANSQYAARVFLGVGGKEDLLADTLALADRLRNDSMKDFSVQQRAFEEETHLSMIPFLYSYGLRAVFERA